MRKIFTAAALLGASAVALGALAAHGLQRHVDKQLLTVFETAVDYHFIHVFALLLVATLGLIKPHLQAVLSKIALGFLSGIGLFCGSLYLWVFSQISWLMWLTPIGGSVFIISWLWLAITLWKKIK